MIEVVSGLIVHDGRILLTQRPAHKSDFPFCWETPGGKVAGMHESHHSALTRELREELGIEVVGISERSVSCVKMNTDLHGKVLWILYPVVIRRTPAPSPREGQGMGWFLPDALEHLDMPPGNSACKQETVRFARAWPI